MENKQLANDKFEVSVFCLTYNHKDYIKDTLEGFLKQKTNFGFKVFVYDDASNDGTSDILRFYKEQYPELFNIYISPKNTYGLPERYEIMQKLYTENLHGKYIAVCEGDDCWLDSNKLQLQIDFMKEHKDCVMTAHASLWMNCETAEAKEYHPYNEDRYLAAEDIIMQNNGNLSTASLVMVRDVFMRDDGFPKCDVDDFPWQLNALCKGKIYYFNKVMSLYRYMHDGAWSKNTNDSIIKLVGHRMNMIRFLLKYDKYSCYRFKKYIEIKIAFYFYGVIEKSLENNINEVQSKRIYSMIENDYKNIAEEFYRIIKWFAGEYNLTNEDRIFIKQFKKIYIMGCGKYSRYIKKCLDNNQIHYDGYVVSQKEEKGQNIFSLSDYPYDKKATLIIVGIGQKYKLEILQALKDNNFENVIYPLWIRFDQI